MRGEEEKRDGGKRDDVVEGKESSDMMGSNEIRENGGPQGSQRVAREITCKKKELALPSQRVLSCLPVLLKDVSSKQGATELLPFTLASARRL